MVVRLIISAFQLLISCIFMGILYWSKLLPEKWLLLIGIGMFAAAAIVIVLTFNRHKKGRFLIGLFMMFVCLCVYGVSGNYVFQGVNTLSRITGSTFSRSEVKIYVCQEDMAGSIEDMEGYTFGILESLDRESTDQAVRQLQSVAKEISVKEYAGISELADALLKDREVQAIIVIPDFLEILTEIQEYEDIWSRVRELYEIKVEMPAETEAMETDNMDSSKVFTVYISGIDSQGGLVSKSRSDVNILAVVNTETHQILLVSTPRDYYVPLSISDGMPDKLTHAGIYGVDVSMKTLEMLYETEIDYYFRVNFSGFSEIVDALDGITVVSNVAFESGKYSFVKGENQLNGDEALTFARQRKAFIDGDRQRGENQMAVIEAVIKKAMSPVLLKNFSEILESIEGNFETSVPYDLIAELVRSQLEKGGDWHITSFSVNGTDATEKPYSMNMKAYVMEPDWDTVEQAISMIEKVQG